MRRRGDETGGPGMALGRVEVRGESDDLGEQDGVLGGAGLEVEPCLACRVAGPEQVRDRLGEQQGTARV